MVQYRRATAKDYPDIVLLNAANFITNLAEEERRDGFLSAIFTEKQVAAMAGELGIMVAVVADKLAGFLCAFGNDFDHGSPVVAKMIASYERMWFEGKSLSSYHSYVYGPVCIDRAFRRKGLLRGLYEAQIQDLAGQFEIGVALISRSNPHSFDAHVAGLGMTEAGEFEVNGNIFAAVAFRL
jgi:ribosomal protein S18 acetylase RimI-like enzyme